MDHTGGTRASHSTVRRRGRQQCGVGRRCRPSLVTTAVTRIQAHGARVRLATLSLCHSAGTAAHGGGGGAARVHAAAGVALV